MNPQYAPLMGLDFLAVILATTMGLSLASAEDADSSPTPEQTYRAFLQRGQHDEAELILRQLLAHHRRDDARRWRFVVDLAALQRQQGEGQTALRTIESLSAAECNQPMASLELARCQTAVGQGDKAMRLLQLLQSNPSLEVRCFVDFEVAQHEFAAERFDACIHLCERVIAEGGKIKMYQHPDAQAIHKLMKDARDLLVLARDRLIASRYGDEYALYRRARIAQAKGEYAKAIDTYRQIKAPVLKDAAGCYVPACLSALGSIVEAARLYQQFIDADEYGLYHGEALYELAKLRLIHARGRGDFDTAHELLARALAWQQDVESKSSANQIEALLVILKEFPVPQEFSGTDRLGNFHRNQAAPETIINRLTCRWYLPHLRAQTQLLYAFTLSQRGEIAQAVALLEETQRSATLNGQSLINHDDMPHRLAHDAADGAFLIPTDCWGAFTIDHAPALWLGFFLHVAGEHGQASALFTRVHESTAGKPQYLQDYGGAQFGLACMNFQNGNEQQAINRLEAFTSTLRQSCLAPLALLVQANLMAGRSDELDTAVNQYADLATKYARSDYAPRALLCLAVVAVNHGHTQMATETCSRLIATYGDTAYADAGRTLAQWLDRGGSSERSANIPMLASGAEGGRVVDFSRTLVVPGESDISFDLGSFASADVMHYRIGWTIRTGCNIKNMRLRLTVLEPQVPSVDKPPLSFVRAPILIETR